MPLLRRQLKPSILVLETTTKCNANCTYCGREGPGEHMDFELYKRIVDASPWAKEVHPLTRGEPLMYPDIIKAIEYAKSKGKKVVIYTNGSLLGTSILLPFLRSGVDEVRLSIDDCKAVPYHSVRRGLNFNVVLNNVRRLVVLRNLSKVKMKISVRATITDVNRDRIDEIREFWLDIVDDFAAVNVLPVLSKDDVAEARFLKSDPIHCPDPWTTLAVRSDGGVVLCCNDWYDDYRVGWLTIENTTPDGILAMFNNHYYWLLRRGMLKNDCPAICVGCRNRSGPKNV